MAAKKFAKWMVLVTFFKDSVSTCTLPTSWNSIWYDSTVNGDLTINRAALTVTGWSRTIFSAPLTTWTCVLDETSNNYVVFRSNQFSDLLGITYYAFMCIKFTMVTENSYYYYVFADFEAGVGDRVKVLQTPTSSISEACSPTNGPSTEEFHMMIKQGGVSSSKQYCPPPLLSTFTYTYNDGSSTTCGGNSRWDVCADRKTMTFDYTACSTKVAFTNEGEIYCVANISSGSTYYTYVINPGTVDNTNYYRFSCLVVSTSGSNTECSIAPNNCQSGQNPTSIPTNGAVATLTPTATCPFVSVTTTSTVISSTLSTTSAVDPGFITGLTLGIFVFIYTLTALLIIVTKECIMNKSTPKEQKHFHNDSSPGQPSPYRLDPISNHHHILHNNKVNVLPHLQPKVT